MVCYGLLHYPRDLFFEMDINTYIDYIENAWDAPPKYPYGIPRGIADHLMISMASQILFQSSKKAASDGGGSSKKRLLDEPGFHVIFGYFFSWPHCVTSLESWELWEEASPNGRKFQISEILIDIVVCPDVICPRFLVTCWNRS